MKKLSYLTILLTAFCFAEEVEEGFPQFEAQKAFLVTVTQDIHAYRNEDRLMMEKKSPAVKPIKTPTQGPIPVRVKMLMQPKKKFWENPENRNMNNVKYNFQLTAKTPF